MTGLQIEEEALNDRAGKIRSAAIKKEPPITASIDWRDIPDADRKDINGNTVKGLTWWQKLAEKELKEEE
jgi:hypothetical protein